MIFAMIFQAVYVLILACHFFIWGPKTLKTQFMVCLALSTHQ